MMQNRPDSTQRAAMLRNMALSVFPDAKGDSLVLFDGKDFKAEPVISFVVRNGRATQQSGDVDLLNVADLSTTFARMANEIEAHAPRHEPIDAARILPSGTAEDESRITLPEGWHARLPASVNASSVFGHFESNYRQEGRDLVIVFRSTGAKGIYPKERVGELLSWLRECAKNRTRVIVIDHGAAKT